MLDMRYRGQSYQLAVAVPRDPKSLRVEEIQTKFSGLHGRRWKSSVFGCVRISRWGKPILLGCRPVRVRDQGHHTARCDSDLVARKRPCSTEMISALVSRVKGH